MQRKELGTTGLSVTPVCVGTSPLGNFPSQYGYEVAHDRAVETIERVLAGPFNFIDTSNNYGDGRSEERIGEALANTGGLPDDFVLATKVDPLPGSSDFSGERVRRSVQESLERLGQSRFQLVYLHDPERMSFEEAVAEGGAVETLQQLRDEGIIEHLGVAGGPIDLMMRYVDLGMFDVAISHNRFTLVEQTAEPLMDQCADQGVAFVNAAPYGGGILVKGPDEVDDYGYQPADRATLSRVRQMEGLAKDHEVPLAAVALQFSLRDPRVASTIVGMSSPERVDQTMALVEALVPDELWKDVAPLVNAGEPVIESA